MGIERRAYMEVGDLSAGDDFMLDKKSPALSVCLLTVKLTKSF